MVMLCSHHLDEEDQIKLLSEDSICDLNVLIENYFSHEHQGFQIFCSEY